ncbi:PAS domain S-box protein [Spirosoma sp. SC4-14]|uniref:PAS domain-containing sensor histidine kinase n=1 Tax=Spirosoma sp. SC4-14 TaxID=3128900 RepID=UPI0030D3836A
MTGKTASSTDESKALSERLDVNFALKAARLGVWELDPITRQFTFDDRCRELFGLTTGDLLSYEQVLRYIHPDDVARVDDAIGWAMNRGSTGTYDVTHRTIGAHDGLFRWVRFIGRSYFNDQGDVYRFAGVAQDVTKDIQNQKLEASEQRFRSLIEEAPVATCLFVGRNMVIEVANEAMMKFWGKGDSVLNRPLTEAIPELVGQPFLDILDNVFTTGQTYHASASKANLVVDGKPGTYYFDFTYKPLLNAAGDVYAIMDMAVDVTEQVIARQKLEESELFSRSIIDNSPVAKIVFVGDDMVIERVNQNMLKMLGRDTSIAGMRFVEALPELTQTPLLERMKHVLATGEMYVQSEEKIELIKYGQLYTGYYNYVYNALRNTSGEIYGMMVTATEITEQVLARQKVEEAEESLRRAVELAELAPWEIDLTSNRVTYSDRMKEWIGLSDNEQPLQQITDHIPENDRERIRLALEKAMRPETDGLYNEVHTIENARTGQCRIIHAQAKTYFDKLGKAYKMIGTAQDITVQKSLQLALEQQVQERTEALEASNQELAEFNKLLTRSNQNLEQFAYIASHDLQEPLRKVQQFGDLLQAHYMAQLGEGADYILRMQQAAYRMSTLIKDLLAFSRISTRKETITLVSLTDIVSTVLLDLDLRIQETNATIRVDSLPTVQGDRSQLGQLFQNLLSNALKFRRPDVEPVIRIRAQQVAAADLPPSVTPTRMAASYYRIDVIDNGIGFDEKYLDRIFQVFQRLHGKNQYAGTGIGLAICEKVVDNHGGAITATSHPNKGATFSVFLPI